MDKIVERTLKNLKFLIRQLEAGYRETESKIGKNLILSPFDIKMLIGAESNLAMAYENLQYYERVRDATEEEKQTLSNYIKTQNEQVKVDTDKEISYYS